MKKIRTLCILLSFDIVKDLKVSYVTILNMKLHKKTSH